MDIDQKAAHQRRILEQFDAQSKGFSKVSGHFTGIETLLAISGVGADSEVLDIACGPGLLACEFAKAAKHVAGADISQEMLRKAAERAASMRQENLSWVRSDAYALPFPDASFDVVTTRYSLHHLLEPARLVVEMLRVCRKGGRMLVCDVVVPDACCAAYDALELIRDDSHVHALGEREFQSLQRNPSFDGVTAVEFGIEIELEEQVAASKFKSQEDAAEFCRRIIDSSAASGSLGVEVELRDGRCFYRCPIKAFSAVKA